jgi:hypothetical protein
MKVDMKVEKKEKTGEEQNIREVAIARVLEEFPFKLAERTRRFEKALLSEGVWFAHVVAYCMIKHLRRDKDLTPEELIREEMYLMPRDQFFEFLSKPIRAIDEAKMEMTMGFYFIPQSALDARRIVFLMLLELERSGRLKIVRPKTNCVKCGVELQGNEYICAQCRDAEIEETRNAILSNIPPPIKSKPDLVESMFRGMYVRGSGRERS